MLIDWRQWKMTTSCEWSRTINLIRRTRPLPFSSVNKHAHGLTWIKKKNKPEKGRIMLLWKDVNFPSNIMLVPSGWCSVSVVHYGWVNATFCCSLFGHTSRQWCMGHTLSRQYYPTKLARQINKELVHCGS